MHEPTFTLCEWPELDERYYKAIHPSGMTVLVCPKDVSIDYATLGVTYGALDALGGRHKTPAGTAHFLEHKMFEGAEGEDTDRTFATLGAEANALTTHEYTAYQLTCADRLGEALRELLAMVLSFRVTPPSVEWERRIIAEEIRQSTDSPYERCYAELLRALYHTHGVREEICGSEASIAHITPAVLRRHYAYFYRPEHMVLSVCGRVTPASVWAVVDDALRDYVPPATPSGTVPAPPTNEPPTVYKPSVTLPMAVAKPLFCIGVKAPAVPTDPVARLRLEVSMTLLSEMLFARSGDWYDDLLEAGVISPSWSYGATVGKGYAYMSVSGEADDPDGIYATYEAYIARLQKEGLSREAFQRSRRVLYADYVTGLDASEDIAEAMLSYAADGLGMFDYPAMLAGVTLEDITALFHGICTPSQTARAAVLPITSHSDDSAEEQRS